MTTLELLASEKCFNNMSLVISKLQKKGENITMKVGKPDINNYRVIKITSQSNYGIYAVGIEMGKLTIK